VLTTNLSKCLAQSIRGVIALKRAALEAFEGRYESEELAVMVDEPAILAEALQLIQQ
jgi:hypothetical protein